MASQGKGCNVFLLVLISFLSIKYVFAYYEFTVENDRICSTFAKKRKLELGYNERSGLALQETRYFNYWPGSYDFNCLFEIKAISKDGIIAVIQNLNLRRNESTGECIDFIQFKPEHGVASEKLCGVITTLQHDVDLDNPVLAKNAFIDVKGELEVQIYVKKQPLKHNEKIDLDLVFTAFKLCAKNPIDYSSCGTEICVWKGFFNDGRINCPLNDCKDESSCAVSFNGVMKKESTTSPWYALLVIGFCTLFLGLCLYLVFRKRRTNLRLHRPQIEVGTPDLEQDLVASAPPLVESPKDKPPPYDSLFPNH